MATRQFNYKRKPLGRISSAEFVRRLANELNVPKHLSKKIMNGVNKVVLDALENHEGISIPYLGVLKMLEYKDPDKIFYGVPRVKLYRYKWVPTLTLDRYMMARSAKRRKELNDT